MKRIILAVFVLMMTLCGMCFGSDITNLAGLETWFKTNAGNQTIAAGTYTLDENLNKAESATLTADGPVIIDCGGSYYIGVAAASGTTTVSFIGTATNTFTVTGGAVRDFLLNPYGGICVLTASFVSFTNGTGNGFSILPSAYAATATLTSCTASGNADDAYSIISASHDGNVVFNLVDCIGLDNGTGGTDQSITTHPNAGTGIDTINITRGSYTGTGTAIYCSGNTVINATGTAFGSDVAQMIVLNEGLVLNLTDCTYAGTTNLPLFISNSDWTGTCTIDGGTILGFGGTAGPGIQNNAAGSYYISNCTVGSSTSRGVWNTGTGTIFLYNCTVESDAQYAAIENSSTGLVCVEECTFPCTYAITTNILLLSDGFGIFKNCTLKNFTTSGAYMVTLGAGCDLAVFDHCTFYNGSKAISWTAGPKVILRHNIFDTFAHADYAILAAASIYSKNEMCDDNLFWNITGTNILSSGTVNANDLSETVNPQFRNPAAGDFTPMNPALYDAGGCKYGAAETQTIKNPNSLGSPFGNSLGNN
jgi:hypothetical protein